MQTMPRARVVAKMMVAGVLMLLWSSCDSQGEQDSFAHQARRPPDGITVATIDGETVSVDPDDWRTSPFYRGRVRVDPAFPNPVSVDRVHIPLTVIGFEAVQGGGLTLRAFAPNGIDLIRLGDIISVDGPGAYAFSFSPGQLGTRALHRVFVFDLAGEIVSYGDILVE